MAAERMEDYETRGFARIHLPMFKDQDYSPEQLALRWRLYTHGGMAGFAKSYMKMLEKGKDCISEIFRYLSGTGKKTEGIKREML